MIKRFNPDFSLSISHELAYMRETPEGGYVAHGDYATLFSELELVKAERDRLQQLNEQTLQVKLQMAATIKEQSGRADALAVENAGLKAISIKLFNLGYLHGHESTVEGYFVDVHRNDIDTYHDDVVAEIFEDEDETPSTSAALAAIEARGAIAAIESLIGKKKRSLAEMHPDTHAYGATEVIIRNQIRDLESFAIELREAK